MKNNRFFIYTLCLAGLLFSLPTTIAQKGDLLLTNSKKVDADRYADIKGTPYIFKDWMAGSITSMEAEVTEAETVNYNAHTQLIEIKKGSQYIELDPAWYIRVFLYPTDSEVLTFQKVFHPALQPIFMQLLYQGEDAQLFKKVEKAISKKVFQDVGKTRTVRQFMKKTTYYLIQNGQFYQFKLNKKSVLKSLGQKKAIESFLKKNKLKLNSEVALKEAMIDEAGLEQMKGGEVELLGSSALVLFRSEL